MSGTLALLNQGGGLGSELRNALESFGANVVFEAPVQALDYAALKNSGARVVVVNLGSADDDIDDLLGALGAEDYEIVINDNEVSAQLAGADQARWARHLAAKILHRPEIILPPAPAGAETIPSFAEHWASKVPSAEEPGRAPVQTQAAPEVKEQPVDAETDTPPPALPEVEVPIIPAVSDIAEPAVTEPAVEKVSVAALSEPETELDADVEFKRALQSFEDAEGHASASTSDLHDLDALLAAASVSTEIESVVPSQAEHVVAVPEAQNSNDTASAQSMHWSLTPLSESEAEALTAAGELEEFHVEKIPAEVYLAPHVDAEPATPATSEKSEAGKATDLDFFSSLELVPLESDVPVERKNSVTYDSGRDLLPPSSSVPKSPKHDAPDPQKKD